MLVATAVAVAGAAHAQTDFSGEWSAVPGRENVDNPQIGEYVGLPLTAGAIRRAEVWDPEIESLPVWQCRPPSGSAIRLNAPKLRIWKQVDPATGDLIAFRAAPLRSLNLPIYMDGRPHPPQYAQHTWTGFATGEWIGDVLKLRTTHLKEGYFRRNGVPQSDRARFTEFLIRRTFRGRDYLTWVVVAEDPVYLAEPLAQSSDYRIDQTPAPLDRPCAIAKPVNGSSSSVPSYLPGTNELLADFAASYGLPARVSSDGAMTMYPEYRTVIDTSSTPAAALQGRQPAARR